MSPEALAAARDWLADCLWQNLEPEEVEDLSDVQVERAVARYYDGGLAQFQSDGGFPKPPELVGVRHRLSPLAKITLPGD